MNKSHLLFLSFFTLSIGNNVTAAENNALTSFNHQTFLSTVNQYISATNDTAHNLKDTLYQGFQYLWQEKNEDLFDTLTKTTHALNSLHVPSKSDSEKQTLLENIKQNTNTLHQQLKPLISTAKDPHASTRSACLNTVSSIVEGAITKKNSLTIEETNLCKTILVNTCFFTKNADANTSDSSLMLQDNKFDCAKTFITFLTNTFTQHPAIAANVVHQFKEKNLAKKEKIHSLKNQVDKNNKQIKYLQQELEKKEQEFSNQQDALSQTINNQSDIILQNDTKNKQYIQTIRILENKIAELNNKNEELTSQMEELQNKIKTQTENLVNDAIKLLESKYSIQASQQKLIIDALVEENKKKETEHSTLTTEKQNLNNQIGQLQQDLQNSPKTFLQHLSALMRISGSTIKESGKLQFLFLSFAAVIATYIAQKAEVINVHSLTNWKFS
jgi:hypothetical protein